MEQDNCQAPHSPERMSPNMVARAVGVPAVAAQATVRRAPDGGIDTITPDPIDRMMAEYNPGENID